MAELQNPMQDDQPLLVAGAIYFVLNFLIARAAAALEYWLSPHLRGRPVAAKVADVL